MESKGYLCSVWCMVVVNTSKPLLDRSAFRIWFIAIIFKCASYASLFLINNFHWGVTVSCSIRISNKKNVRVLQGNQWSYQLVLFNIIYSVFRVEVILTALNKREIKEKTSNKSKILQHPIPLTAGGLHQFNFQFNAVF